MHAAVEKMSATLAALRPQNPDDEDGAAGWGCRGCRRPFDRRARVGHGHTMHSAQVFVRACSPPHAPGRDEKLHHAEGGGGEEEQVQADSRGGQPLPRPGPQREVALHRGTGGAQRRRRRGGRRGGRRRRWAGCRECPLAHGRGADAERQAGQHDSEHRHRGVDVAEARHLDVALPPHGDDRGGREAASPHKRPRRPPARSAAGV